MTAASPSATSMASTCAKDLVVRGASRVEIETHIDRLPVRERLEQVLAITGKNVGRLYDAVAGAPPIALEDICPREEKGTVILEGRNSLPPGASRFQKRFAWVGDALIGYNHQIFAPLVGPGFFAVRPAPGEGPHAQELYFDYTAGAPPAVPAGWPAYKPNERGVSRLVYAHMLDYCRRVATGVLVGKAYKHGEAMGAYFTLTSAR